MATEVGSAFFSLVPKCDGVKDQIQGAMSDPVSAIGDKLGLSLGDSATAALSKMVVPAAIVGIGAAIGKELYDVGASFDSMYDTIKTGTGATGDALASLEESARNVYASVPASLDDVGDTLAELNTRTGLTGESLEGLTEAFLQLDEIGYSTDIDAATGMMTAWGVSTEDMEGKLNELFVVSQSTGISIDSISSAMSTNATAMQELGFSFEDTAAMAGQLDKAGLDASSMMSKMSKACISLAQDGEQPAEAYQRIVGEMQGFIDAGDEASAMNLASELFGTKGAAQFVQALETGALDLSEMTSAMEGADGAISANAESTRSASESFELLKQNAALCLEPLGSAVFGTVADILGAAVPVVQDLASAIGGGFTSAVQTVSGVIETASGVMETFRALFAGELTFPSIKLPHFSVYGGELPWGIGGQGIAPSISVEWYAKGGVMTGATPFSVSVGGEAGNEGIVPLEGHYMQPFAQATAQYMGMDEVVAEIRALREQMASFAVYVDGKTLVGSLMSEIDRQNDSRTARRSRYVAVS